MRKRTIVVGVGLLVTLVACTSRPADPPPVEVSGTVLAANDDAAKADNDNGNSKWGTIKGRIVFDGDQIPKRPVIDAVNQHQDKKHCLSKGDLLREDWVVDPKNKGVRWTLL